MKERQKAKQKTKNKSNLKSKNILLILGVIYTLISILAVVSYVSKMNTISTTPVTIGSVLASVWWQILMITLFAVSYILYTKKPILGILTEILMGLAMLVYIVISVATMGIDFLALIIEIIYPLILVLHGLAEFKKLNKKAKRKKSTV